MKRCMLLCFVGYLHLMQAQSCPSSINIVNTVTAAQYYKAGQILTASSQVSVTGVTYRAGNYVQLNPGFKSAPNIKFEAKIAPCSAPNTREGEVEVLEEIADELVAFPNPTLQDRVHFNRTVLAYSLSNAWGIVVLSGHNAEEINVGQLPKGVYMLTLENTVQKLVIE